MTQINISNTKLEGRITEVKTKIGANCGLYISIKVVVDDTHKAYYKNYFINSKNDKAKELNIKLLDMLKHQARVRLHLQLVNLRVKFDYVQDEYNNIYHILVI